MKTSMFTEEQLAFAHFQLYQIEASACQMCERYFTLSQKLGKAQSNAIFYF